MVLAVDGAFQIGIEALQPLFFRDRHGPQGDLGHAGDDVFDVVNTDGCGNSGEGRGTRGRRGCGRSLGRLSSLVPRPCLISTPDPGPRTRFVQHVDGFVGQMAIVHVFRGELGCQFDGVVGEGDAVMFLVVRLQALENLDGLLDRRLADLDLLEAPGQSAIALERRLVFRVGRRADAAQLPGRDGGLEDVRRVHRSAAHRSGADDGVDLVDEEDRIRLGQQRIHDRFQALLELTAILRAGENSAHIERPDDRVFQHGRNLILRDLEREPLGDCSLTDAGLTDEEGIVLPSPAENLNGSLQLRLAADKRIDLTFLRPLVQVDGEEFERIAGLLGRRLFIAGEGRLRRGRVFADAVREVLQHIELVHSLAAQQVNGLGALGLIDRREHLPGVDFFLPRRLRVKLCVLHDALEHGGEHRLDLGVIGELFERPVHEIVELLLELRNVAAAGVDDLDDVAVVQQGVEQMLERHVLVAPFHRLVEGEFEGLLQLAGNHVRRVGAVVALRIVQHAHAQICDPQREEPSRGRQDFCAHPAAASIPGHCR